MAPPNSTDLPGWGPHCRTVPSSPREPKTQILRYLTKTQILCVPDCRARGCFLHVALSTNGEDTALGGIYQAFPCHKRSFQNNLSAAETQHLSPKILIAMNFWTGEFSVQCQGEPWTFKQAKHYCALSTLLMVSPAHKRSPRNKTDLLNGFNIHLLGKGLLDRRPLLVSPSLSLCFLYLEDTFQVPPDVWVLQDLICFNSPVDFACLPILRAGTPLQHLLSKTYNTNLTTNTNLLPYQVLGKA